VVFQVCKGGLVVLVLILLGFKSLGLYFTYFESVILWIV